MVRRSLGSGSEKEREREGFAGFEMGRSWNWKGSRGEEAAVEKGRKYQDSGRI